jgi:hypothetical protein
MKTEKQVRTIEFSTIKTEQGFHVVYHMDKCAHEIFMKQQDWKFISHEDHLAIVAELESRIANLREVVEFYSNGGHPAMDMWQHPDLGYFTGKRARQALEEDKSK